MNRKRTQLKYQMKKKNNTL